MKTAVSIPDKIFEAADRVARRLGISRSQLYATAVKRFIDDHRNDGVTEALDAVYAEVDSRVDPVIARMQAAVLEADEW